VENKQRKQYQNPREFEENTEGKNKRHINTRREEKEEGNTECCRGRTRDLISDILE
jgi:hypothetical protein